MRPLQDGHSNDGLPHGTQMQQVSGGPQIVGFRQQGRQQDLLLRHQQDTREARVGRFSLAGLAQADTHSPIRPMTMLPPTPRQDAGSGSAAVSGAPAVLASPSAAGMMRQFPRPMLSPHTLQATRYMQMPAPVMAPNGSAAAGFAPSVFDPRAASLQSHDAQQPLLPPIPPMQFAYRSQTDPAPPFPLLRLLMSMMFPCLHARIDLALRPLPSIRHLT